MVIDMEKTGRTIPFVVLVSRFFLFAFFQAVIAGIFYLTGAPDAWHEAEGWWPIGALLTNIVSMLLLVTLFKKEGKNLIDEIRFTKQDWWKDLLIALGILVIAAPMSTFPGNWLAKSLFGSADAAYPMMFRPLPLWAGIIGLAWPLTQGLVELPTYFAYAMPRLEKSLGNGWIAWALASLFLAVQHAALPLIWDYRFMLWRFGMFALFAFFVGLCLKLRPRLFPYLMIAHGLMDMAVAVMVLTAKAG